MAARVIRETRLRCTLRGRYVILTWTHRHGVGVGCVPDDSGPTITLDSTGEVLDWVLTDAEQQELMELM